MASGLLAGGIAGTGLVVTGTLPERADPQLTILSCYENGKEIGQVTAGQSMLITGRSPDGTWLEVYLGVPGADRGWAPASALRFGATPESLPVSECIGFLPLASPGPPATPLTSAPPTVAPSEVPSVVPTVVATVIPTASPAPSATPTPTPRPTRTARPTPTPLPPPPTIPPPTPSPTPAPTADVFVPTVSAPYITSPNASPGGSYFIGSLPCAPPTATIRVNASDPSGVSTVTLYYRVDPYNEDLPPLALNSAPMSDIGGGVYQYVLDPVNSWTSGEMSLWVRATDTHGNTTGYVPFGNPYSKTDVSLFWDPFCVT